MSEPRKRKNASIIENPRIGALTPDEFRSIASAALGGRGWQKALVHATGWSQSTISRYLNGALPIPKDVALLLKCLTAMRDAGMPLPDDFLYDREVEEATQEATQAA